MQNVIQANLRRAFLLLLASNPPDTIDLPTANKQPMLRDELYGR